MSTKTRKTKEELYAEAKAEYMVPVNLKLTMEQAAALHRAVIRGIIDDEVPEMRQPLIESRLSSYLEESMIHAYESCEDLALSRYIGQE